MISVDRILEHYLDDVECLRLVKRAARQTSFSSQRFGGLTPLLLDAQLEELRKEIDKAFVLTMAASSEATIRTDFSARVNRATPAFVTWWKRLAFRLRLHRGAWTLVTLEDHLVHLHVRYGKKVPLDEILNAWRSGGANVNLVGQFKQLKKHRDWLAHGRYWSDRSGVSPDPHSGHAVITTVFAEFTALRPNFPL